MNKILTILGLTATLAASCCLGSAVPARAAGAGRAECVVEVSSRRILHGKSEEARLPMASTTKILTAIIVIEDCDLDEVIEIPKAAEGVEGSSVYLHAGDEYSVRDLLYGLMLRSGNDCAVTLALHHSGSVEQFAHEMTERAALMGAVDSNFENPHGLPNNAHYTTARDLALVAAHAMQNETFCGIVSCKYYAARGWQNKNKMLKNYEGAIGVKTGFTTAAGRCLVTAADRNGMRLVSVVLNCPEMYERTTELLDEAYEEYQMIPICDRTAGYEGFAVAYDFAYPLKKTELRSLRFDPVLSEPLPQGQGEVAGQLKIYLEKNLIFSQNLYIM